MLQTYGKTPHANTGTFDTAQGPIRHVKNENMSDRTHVMTIRVSELTFAILQAREPVDGRAAATQVSDLVEELADRERHASNLIQRAIEGQQAGLSPGKREAP